MPKKKSKIVQIKSLPYIELAAFKSKFLEKITTLHGVNYFIMKKGRSLSLWTFLMAIHVVLTIAFLVIIKDRYNSGQIATKIYSDWSVDKVPFPAVTICNYNLVSVNESRIIEDILQKQNISQDEIESFFRDLFYLRDFGEGSTKVPSYSKIMDTLKSHYYNLDTIMEEVHQKCDNLLVYCSFNGKQKNCNDLFTEVQTYMGYCCSFNFNGLEEDELDPSITRDEDFEYYYDQGADGEDIVTNMIATSQSGSSSGLEVVFNVEPKDYGTWNLVPAYGAKILLSDPNDFIETRVIYRYMTIGESMDLKVQPMIFQCEENLRFVDVDKRGCWFHDEVHLENTNRYSFETCSTECRIKSYQRYCGCVPFKYPVGKEIRICEFSDLKCLNYMKAHWESKKTPCVPECYKECQDKDYTVITDIFPFFSDGYPDNVTTDRNASELASLRVYYIQSNCNCYMMSLLTDTNTFIATYGGIFSICFGASIMTIFELIYLSLASFATILWRKLKNKVNINCP